MNPESLCPEIKAQYVPAFAPPGKRELSARVGWLAMEGFVYSLAGCSASEHSSAHSPPAEVTAGPPLWLVQEDNRARLAIPLTLSYASPDERPDSAAYSVHDTGNLAFYLSGPNFPTHFGERARAQAA
ncbi:MAG: hypothetical protein ABIQ16_26590 [Polyangiaceae bacterium]